MDEPKILRTLETVERHLQAEADQLDSERFGATRFTTPEELIRANASFTISDTTKTNCLKFYKKHCMELCLTPDTLYRVFVSFYRFLPEDAVECFLRWKDAIPHLQGETRSALLKTIARVCHELASAMPEQVFFCACALYEYGEFEICYQLLEYTLTALDELAFLPSWKEKNDYPDFSRVNMVVDCCKFLRYK